MNITFAEEFVAHGANVNCLAMGHKTGRVMVTGGEDRKVNLWTAGKPNCIMVCTLLVYNTKYGPWEFLTVSWYKCMYFTSMDSRNA